METNTHVEPSLELVRDEDGKHHVRFTVISPPDGQKTVIDSPPSEKKAELLHFVYEGLVCEGYVSLKAFGVFSDQVMATDLLP